jgi:hypothetical protein
MFGSVWLVFTAIVAAVGAVFNIGQSPGLALAFAAYAILSLVAAYGAYRLKVWGRYLAFAMLIVQAAAVAVIWLDTLGIVRTFGNGQTGTGMALILVLAVGAVTLGVAFLAYISLNNNLEWPDR